MKISLAATALGTGAGLVALRDVTQIDKFKHMGVAGAATVALGLTGMSATLAATTVFIGASVGKELVFDHLMGRGNASLFDVSANLAGALAGLAVLKLGQASFSSGPSRNSLLGAPAPPVSSDAMRLLPDLRDPNLQNDSGVD